MITKSAKKNLDSKNFRAALSEYEEIASKLGRNLFWYNLDICYKNAKLNIEDVTAVIKTFERPQCLKKLLKSINKFYPSLNVVIVDSSSRPIDLSLKEWQHYFWVGFDKGLSYGRNYALKKVQTKLFLLLDDDFVFCEKTKIELLIDDLINSHLDIVGGLVEENGSLMNYYSNFSISEGVLSQTYVGGDQNLLKCDIVLNFFLAKTQAIIESGGWDNRLKLAEHTDFFVNAKLKNLRTGYSKRCTVLHEPERIGDYAEYRKRGAFFTDIMMLKRNIKKIINVHGSVYIPKGIPKDKLALNSKMLYHNEHIADSHLRDVACISKELSIDIFLSNGTLLGMRRENSYIGHDTDLDFGIMAKQYSPKIIDEFFKKGYQLFGEYGSVDNGYEISLIKNNIKLDIFFYYEYDYKFSMSVWDKSQQIKYVYSPFNLVNTVFRDVEILIPDDVDKYLCEQYGSDWSTPVVSWDWKSSPSNLELVKN